MCDVHLCDDAIEVAYHLGPKALIMLAPEIAAHIVVCEVCAERLGLRIMLDVESPVSEHVM